MLLNIQYVNLLNSYMNTNKMDANFNTGITSHTVLKFI